MKEAPLDYRYLHAFLLTAQELNFSRAAEMLNIAQSAVSRQIKLLEESVGEQLIIRSSKKAVLTEKGEALLHLLEKFEGDVDHIFHGKARRPLRVGVLHGLLETWFNDIIAEYAKGKGLPLVVEIRPMEQLKEKLLARQFDLVFSSENIQNELVSSLRLFDEKLVLISKAEVNPREAWDYPWVAYNENDNIMHVYKKRPKQVIAVNSITAMVDLVRKGVGVAVVPEHLLKPSDSLRTYELKGLPKSSIFLSTLNFQTLPEPLRGLVELIKKRVP